MKRVSGEAGERPVTIRDVARYAGVSAATVSRVLNDVPVVNPDTRASVQWAIEELGYRRSSVARSLSVGRSQAVGVVAPFFTTPSVVERLRGVVDRLAARGYDLLLFDVEQPQQRIAAFRDFARRDRLDGLLVISLPLSERELGALRRDELPVVLVDVSHPALPHVAVDDVHGGELATRHLLGRGHRRIAFVGDSADNPFGLTSSEQRRQGYLRALAEAGVEHGPELQALGGYGREAARTLAARLLDLPEPPTAVFAASDMQAVGVLEAAQARGLDVPGDLAVIGFDDVEVAAIVGLTTIRQPLHASGAHGADLLMAQIEGADPPLGAGALDALALVERRTT
jgi:DNA-binding LacI/PurR family transcriptional regulator